MSVHNQDVQDVTWWHGLGLAGKTGPGYGEVGATYGVARRRGARIDARVRPNLDTSGVIRLGKA